MSRTIAYRIPYTDQVSSPKTVKGFLKSLGYSAQNLKILKQSADAISQDGIPLHLNAPLSPGSLLTIRIHEESSSENILPVKLPFEILFEDEDIMVCNKPAGMPIHPSQNNRDNTLANALAYYFQEQGKPFIFRCIGRLDRDTSGLTIIAKHSVSAGILGTALLAKSSCFFENDTTSAFPPPSTARCPLSEDHTGQTMKAVATGDQFLPLGTGIRREYLAIVRGSVTPSEGTINAPLGRKPGSIIERCIDYDHGENAVTHYRLMEEKNGYSLVSLLLETGRTHQIRIHMKHIGYPLIGDYLYNPDMERIHRQALHSHRLVFRHPITGQRMDFTAPFPTDMKQVLDLC